MHVVSASAGSLNLTTTSGGVELDAASVSASRAPGTGALVIDSADGLVFGANGGGGSPVAAASLAVTARGAVSQTVPLSIGGATSIDANGGDVTLDAAQNDFDTISVTGAAVTLDDANGIQILQTAASGPLTVQSHGALTVGGSVSGGGDITLVSNTGSIALLTPGATPTTVDAAGTLTLRAAQNIGFGANTAASAAGELVIAAGGSLAMDPASGASAGGSLTASAGADATVATLSSADAAVSVTAQGSAEFVDAVTLAGPLSVAAGSDGVKFDGAIDGGAPTADLTVSTSGPVTFAGALGGAAALHSLTTEGGGPVTLENGTVSATGSIDFGGAVTVASDTTFSAPILTFGGSLDGIGAGAQAITVDPTGTATFDDAVGAGEALSSFTTSGGTA
ncbi:MAG: hypothetical protein ACRDL8_12340, partial [Solirubrobacteraceae bacterium]